MRYNAVRNLARPKVGDVKFGDNEWAYRDVLTDKVKLIPESWKLGSLKISNDYDHWGDLFQYEKLNKSESAFKKAKEKNNYHIISPQRMKDADSDKVNTDYYGIKIEKLPDLYPTTKEFYDHIRLSIQDLTKSFSPMEPYDEAYKKWWEGEDIEGSVLKFNTALDDLSVLTSKSGKNYWIFTPITTNDDGYHVLAGHRQFGLVEFTEGDRKYWIFYIRAIDVPYTKLDWAANLIVYNTIFENADHLWRIVMCTANAWINGHSGALATEIVHYNNVIDWDDDVNAEDK